MHEKSQNYLFEENALHGDYRFRIFLGDPNFLNNTFGHQKFVSTLAMFLQLLLPNSFEHLFDEKLAESELETLSADRLISVCSFFISP
jgi:hypothetical protein